MKTHRLATTHYGVHYMLKEEKTKQNTDLVVRFSSKTDLFVLI